MIKKINVMGAFNIVSVLEVIDGKNHRRTIAPRSDISNESQDIQDACNAAWTPDIVQAYQDHLAATL